ncbi:hypothetical protein [Cellulomonas alba]|uniref:OmpA-like domain-containing protein n=1 Tax=Cellulomonas alba TaxID=3053467 RepID=A0ABT7SG34_9CELL|nr:hypothetical protein [Cellulomonas alba]MDM7855157.1 hypothetical protein [Cellulomonas alba]
MAATRGAAMAGLWDSIPGGSQGALGALEPLLSSVPGTTESQRTESDGDWKIWSNTLGGDKPMDLDMSTGAFTHGIGSGAGNDGVLELSGGLGVELGLHLDSGGDPDGPVRVVLTVPSSSLRLPFLRGAALDGQGQLRADPAHATVKFLLPSLKVRLLRPADGGLKVDLLDASGAVDDDPVLNLVRMDPPYALVGPDDVVGFAFRAAVLDLSGTAGPTGVPDGARTMPDEWQGLYLPEIRLFVSPNGLSGLAVSAGVRDLWIGFGRFAGVTGVFNAEVVNRGSAPNLRLRFQTAAGEWIGVSDTDPIGDVDLPEHVTLYADGGGGVAPLSFSLTVDGTVTASDRAPVTVPASGSVSISASCTDAGSHTTTRTLTVSRRSAAAITDGTSQPVTPATTSSTGYVLLTAPSTATAVTVSLSPDPGGTVAWTWDGQTTPVTGATADIPVTAGTPVHVTATVTRTTAETTTVDAYFEFDHPSPQELTSGPSTRWTDNPDSTTSSQWASRHDKGSAPPLLSAEGLQRLAALPKSTVFSVEGWASAELPGNTTKQEYNLHLSERRRDALIAILTSTAYPELGFAAPTAVPGHGQTDAEGASGQAAQQSPGWWHARATAHLNETVTVTGTLTRSANPPDPQHTDPRPTPPPTPDCFRKIGVTVELVRSTFVRAEIYGEFDIQTAAEQRLSASDPGATIPPRDNPSDGICQFLLRLRIAEDRSSWEVDAQFKAIDADKDGLLQKTGDGTATGLNILGALAVLSPLLATATPASPTAGELVPMALATGGVVALGATGVIKTMKLTLHGGQLVVTSGLVDPSTGDGPRATSISILIDVETSFTFDVSPLLKVDPAKPLTARYKAVGIRSSWRSDPQPDGTVQYVPLPVFDPSQGYSLDIPTGSLIGPNALKDILRVLGGKISKDNPTYLEVEVGLGVDLGIVTVDTARVRVRLDQPDVPQLTALGAHVTIPDVLHGGGRVSIDPGGFSGSFDLTMDSLNLRVAAQLAVHQEGGVTGVLVGAEVQFPVAIPLGSSGLGIMGFLGGVAVNYARNETPYASEQVPALAWMKAQLTDPNGSIMKPDGWRFQAGAYAVAGGILLGTAEGGFIVHLKGMVLVEVPGPRLLFAMKADVISPPPVLSDANAEATFVAVLDINIGAGTITLGLVADYTVKSLVKVHVPVTAFFDTNHVDEWLVDLGTYDVPVTVSVLDVFTGTGYLMVHGDGSTVHIPTLPIVANGLVIAVGFHMQVVLMGSKAVGLYLEVDAGFDALVSFSPPGIAGFIHVKGELRLWIIGISVSASLTVVVGTMLDAHGAPQDVVYVHGEVCGEVDFFFFSVKGCVSLTIGDPDVPAPVPPPLVKGVNLVSRSPALVLGSAIDRSVDGVIGTAVEVGAAGDLPSVPLDAIPVIGFETPPLVKGGDIVLGGVANGSSGAPANPWVKHGDTWWRYRLTSVQLSGALQPAAPDGKTPATWWASASPDPSHGASLALLSWIPTATPRAVTLGQSLTTTVTETWGTVCTPVADAAPVLWTFDDQATGPSAAGWDLVGVPWPDEPGTQRSVPADLRAHVSEPWRTGDALADLLQGTSPALVVGDLVRCGRERGQTRLMALSAASSVSGAGASFGSLPIAGASSQDVVDLLAAGTSLQDLPAAWALATVGGATAGAPSCRGAILRSPVGDEPEPAPHALPPQRDVVKKVWDAQGFAPSDLGDAVVLHASGGFASLDALVLVPRKALERGLVVHFRDASGALLDEYRATGADLLSASHSVPPSWVDASGPWLDPVLRAAQVGARVVGGSGAYAYAVLSPKVPHGTVDVEIGWDRKLTAFTGMAFWLVAFGATTTAEVDRQDWDTQTVDSDKSSVTNAVEQDPDDHALLVPGQTYTVHVEWEAQSKQQDDQPSAAEPEAYAAGDPQEFQFVADGQADAPQRLDPWLLSTAPDVGETGFLLGEPLQVALATQKVSDLFDAYGLEIRIVVRAASGRHPSPPGGGAPGQFVTVPVGLGGVLQAADPGLQVMTPWQQTVTALLDELPCVDGSGSTTHHSVITLDYALEPLTDYLLDVYAVPKGAPDDATGTRLYRVPFTTSRFTAVADLAALVIAAPVRASLVPTPAGLATLTARPTGDQLDAAFQAAGLPVPQVPRYPSVTVLWSPDAVPQPVAVVIEGGETFWRARPVPTFVTGLVVDDPTQGWWVAEDTDWLALQVSTSTPGAGDLPRAPVTRLVRAPGDTRAVVLLGPSARGTELVLDLVRAADPLSGTAGSTATAARVPLVRAPWEMED